MAIEELGPPPGRAAGARTTQRRGRMSDAKRDSLVALGPRWMVDPARALDPAALDAAFGRSRLRLLDVGGGTGDATVAWARLRPDHDVIALELHRPGIVQLVRRLEEGGPDNVRVAEADVTQLLAEAPPATFAGIRILFPDPWPKRRHLRRRLVDADVVAACVDLLVVGGTLHLATDWGPYADQMRAALATDARLRVEVVTADGVVEVPTHEVAGLIGPSEDPEQPPPWRSPRPERPTTRYEQRGLDADRTIVDLVAHRRA